MNHDIETNKYSNDSPKENSFEVGVDGVGRVGEGKEKASGGEVGSEMIETSRTNSDTDDTTTTNITVTMGTINIGENTVRTALPLPQATTTTQATTSSQAITTSIQKTTLWMGELEYWMDEGFLVEKWWELLGEKLPFLKLKLIRDRFTGYVI